MRGFRLLHVVLIKSSGIPVLEYTSTQVSGLAFLVEVPPTVEVKYSRPRQRGNRSEDWRIGVEWLLTTALGCEWSYHFNRYSMDCHTCQDKLEQLFHIGYNGYCL